MNLAIVTQSSTFTTSMIHDAVFRRLVPSTVTFFLLHSRDQRKPTFCHIIIIKRTSSQPGADNIGDKEPPLISAWVEYDNRIILQ